MEVRCVIALNRQVRSALEADRGFTLVELVVVAAVLSMLVSLALPSYFGARNKAAVDEANSMAQEWKSEAWGCVLMAYSGAGNGSALRSGEGGQA